MHDSAPRQPFGAGSARRQPNNGSGASSDLEQRFRAIVMVGLLPVLLGIAGGFGDPSYADEQALARLRLVEPAAGARLILSPLGRDVAQQLAALHVAGDLPDVRSGAAWWAAPLLVTGKPNDYGATLLAWLRVASMRRTCAAPDCGGAAVGVLVEPSGERSLACARHRCDVRVLALEALDRALAGVPSEGVANG
jgi:hypothetical protein